MLSKPWHSPAISQPAAGSLHADTKRSARKRVLLFIYLSFFDRNVVLRIGRPDVIGAGPDQPVVVELLDHVCGPSADARNCKHWREQIHFDSESVVGRSRIEIDVGVELLVGLDEIF